MTADVNRGTSISDGFEAAGLLFSDGAQSIDAALGKWHYQTAIDAAALVKGTGVTVFAWGIGKNVILETLQQIATEPSKAILAPDLANLTYSLAGLEAAVCNESPPPSPPSPPSPPTAPPQEQPVRCGNPD